MSANQPIITNDQSPLEAPHLYALDTELEELLKDALRGYLLHRVTQVRDAPRMSLGYRQFTLNDTNPHAITTLVDNGGLNPGIPRYTDIVTLVCETQNVRYSTDGSHVSSNYGMLMTPGQYIDVALIDPGGLVVCAATSGAVLNVEYFRVPA